MPAKTGKQRKAAGAELARRRKGLKRKLFRGMSDEELRHYASKAKKKHRKRRKK